MPKPTAFNCASTRWAVGSSCATKWLMPRLNGFYARHPGVLVHVHSRVRRFDLTQAGIDAVIGVGYDDWPGMVTHPLMDETVVPVISPLLLQQHPISEAAGVSRHLLMHVAQRPGIWRQWFTQHGVPVQTMRSGPQFELTSHLIQAVASGMGVGLLPHFLVADELQSGVLALAIDLPMDTGARYSLYTPPEKLAFPPIAAFRDWLVGEVGTPPQPFSPAPPQSVSPHRARPPGPV